MEIIRIYVNKNVASCTLATPIVCRNTDYRIEFILDEEWAEYPDKIARFIWNDQFVDVPFTGNICPMPPVYDTDKCTIGLIAEGFQASTGATIRCQKSVKCIEVMPNAEQTIRDTLKTDVPNDADDELTRFLEGINNSILAKEGAEAQPMNPQGFTGRIDALPSFADIAELNKTHENEKIEINVNHAKEIAALETRHEQSITTTLNTPV